MTALKNRLSVTGHQRYSRQLQVGLNLLKHHLKVLEMGIRTIVLNKKLTLRHLIDGFSDSPELSVSG